VHGTVRSAWQKRSSSARLRRPFIKPDKTPDDGVPREVVYGLRDGTANHRSQFFVPATKSYNWCSFWRLKERQGTRQPREETSCKRGND
jgi:hypothetical protein